MIERCKRENMRQEIQSLSFLPRDAPRCKPLCTLFLIENPLLYFCLVILFFPCPIPWVPTRCLASASVLPSLVVFACEFPGQLFQMFVLPGFLLTALASCSHNQILSLNLMFWLLLSCKGLNITRLVWELMSVIVRPELANLGRCNVEICCCVPSIKYKWNTFSIPCLISGTRNTHVFVLRFLF